MNLVVNAPVLETERLWLRLPRMEDFDTFATCFASDRTRYIDGPYPERATCFRLFSSAAGQWLLRGCGPFVFERKDTGTAIGHGGPWHPITHPEPELGWVLWSAAVEGHGFAAEAIAAARHFAYDSLGWHTAVSYIAPGNQSSIALAERLGAKPDDAAPQPFDSPRLIYRHPGPTELAGKKGAA